jgi:hypothetical protein
MTNQVPSVGRVVHYVAYGTPGGEFPAGAHRAAIITTVDMVTEPSSVLGYDYKVGLCVLNPNGMYFCAAVPYDDGERDPNPMVAPTPDPGTWHWPEYVPD